MTNVDIYETLYKDIASVVAKRKPIYQNIRGFVNMAVAQQLRMEGVKV